MKELDTIDNLKLIGNSLEHLNFELERTDSSYFRIARESHLILYRGMIQVLKGSANLDITGRPTKNRQHRYHKGNFPWKEIHKEELKFCEKAWRFSTPVECNPPEIDYQIIPPMEDFLIAFYDALAMIQTECFMNKSLKSKTISVSDEEMQVLEWLHENVRNEYEHFTPRLYTAPTYKLCKASIISLTLTKKLIFESGNVISAVRYKNIESLINQSLQKIRAHIE